MKRTTRYAGIITMLAYISLFLSACDDDDNSINGQTKLINNFIWTNMDAYYLWRDEMPDDLNPNTEPDPEAFFEKLLYRPTDRWSYITDDATELEESFQGISKTFGYSFQLYKFSNSDDVYGIIQYVIPGLPADNAALKRGDVFLKINNKTLNTTNYYDLLFTNEEYTLTMGELVDQSISLTDKEVNLTAIKAQENPILLDTIINTDEGKVGYVVYNQFINTLESDLVDLFESFKNEGIEHLVLDLRYNPGGYGSTATVLTSLIAPTANVSDKDVFYEQMYNDILTD